MKISDPQSVRCRFSGIVRAARLLTIAGTLWAAVFPLSAQEPKPPEAAATPAPRVITKEQKIYVPFEKLEQLFEGQEQGVFLPYREFLDMWNKLNLPAALNANEPPVEGVLASAHYAGKVTGDVATLEGKLSFEALKKGWSKLKLGAPGLALSEAKTTGVLSAGADGYEMLFPEKGPYTLDATILGKIKREAGRSTLELPLPKTAVSQFELTIPEKGLDFTIAPAAAYSATETPEGGTKLLVYFGAAEKVTVGWTHRVGETALKPLLFAEAKTTVRIGSGAVRTEAVLTYRILRAGVDTLEVLVPAEQQVLSVEGQNIREWNVEAVPKSATVPAPVQRVKVTLHTPARDTYSLRLRLERALKQLPEAVPFPVIQAAQAERQTGTLSLFTEPELTAEVSALTELTQQAAAPAEKGKMEEAPAGEFRYLRVPYGGTVTVSGAKPQVEVTSQTLVVVNPDLLEVRATFNGTVKRAGIFGLQIDLPPGLTRVEATGDQVESSSVQTVDNKEVLSVKFRTRQTGNFEIQLTSDAPRAKADAPLTIPVFYPRAERHEARVGVAIHVSLKASTTDRGELREEDVRDLVQIAVPKPELTPLTLGFRYRATPKPAQVQFELRKPRASAVVSALLEVRESLLRHVWTIDYTVEYAGVDEFFLAVPAKIADEVQIDGTGIKERTKLPDPPMAGAPEGTVVWRVAMQSKVLGGTQLKVTYDQPRGEATPGQTTPVTLQELTTVGLFRETGQVAVIKDGNIEIVKNEAKGLELIDPKELGPALSNEKVFLAWKYSAHPLALRLDVSKNLYLEVPTALVSYAVLTSVIAEDEAETTEAIYWLRNNGQQFFSVQLPATAAGAARLLSDAYVEGEPQQPSKRPDRNELLIRLPARDAAGGAFPVRFVYEVPSPHPGQHLGWRGTLHLQPPIVAGVETLQSSWTLYLPEDHRYLSFKGSMRETVDRRGWDLFRAGLDFFVPQIGPIRTGLSDPRQAEAPPLPAPKTAGFNTQLQREGLVLTLRRLGEPAAVGVVYCAKGYAATVETIAFLLSLGCGIVLFARSRRERFLYFSVVGLGALVIAGAVSPRAAGAWQSIYLGALLALVLWLVAGAVRSVAGWRLPRWRSPVSQPAQATYYGTDETPVTPVVAPDPTPDPEEPAPAPDPEAAPPRLPKKSPKTPPRKPEA